MVVLNVPEDQAVTKVEIRSGDYLDRVKICLSNGTCKEAGGSDGVKKTFEKNRSVIKAFFYKAGEVVDRLGVHYETDKIIRLESKDPSYTPTNEVVLDDVYNPDNLLINDNSGGSSAQRLTFTTATEITTTETTTVSTTFGTSVGLSLTASAGINLGLASAGVESTFSAGASWSTTNEKALSFSETTTKELAVSLVALPGFIEQAETYYTQAQYEYSWTAPLTCYYSFAPGTAVTGDHIAGITKGTHGIPTIQLQFTTVQEPSTSTPSLRPVPSKAPVQTGTAEAALSPADGPIPSRAPSSGSFFPTMCFSMWTGLLLVLCDVVVS